MTDNSSNRTKLWVALAAGVAAAGGVWYILKRRRPTTTPRLSSVWVYPVKSCAGIELSSSQVHVTGLRHDRRFLIVLEDGKFLTQRQLPIMASIRTALKGTSRDDVQAGELHLWMVGAEEDVLCVPLQHDVHREQMDVRIWKDTVQAADRGDECAAWLSNKLGKSVRLVEMQNDFQRWLEPCDQTERQEQVSFADRFPFLVVSEASLAELNRRLANNGEEEVDMRRFRPNLVVDGCDAFEEDTWREMSIGPLKFYSTGMCARCSIPTIDPDTCVRAGRQPTATLREFRARADEVFFGQNFLVHHDKGWHESRSLGDLNVGTEVVVDSVGEPHVPP